MDHTLEISPSGRATCRTCKKKIAKDELRFGEMVASQFAPEGAMQWHHLACGAAKKGALVKPLLEAYTGDVPDREALMKAAESSAATGKGAAAVLPNADLAPTGRARCIACHEAIAKGTVRVGVEREIDTGSFTTKGAGYLHPACVTQWAEEHETTLEALVEQITKNTTLETLPAPLGDGA